MKMPSAQRALRSALSKLKRYGILLESDSKLPSVATIVAGEPIRGSWWGHPLGHEIHYIAWRVASSRNVVVTKLVSAKVTFVHRKLWPLIVAVGSSRQKWQLKGLSRRARKLLLAVDEAGRVRTDRIRIKGNPKEKSIGDAARELEFKLLVHSQEIHTDTGAHVKILETWEFWNKEVGFVGKKMATEEAKKRLEKVLADLNYQFDARGYLPWNELKGLH